MPKSVDIDVKVNAVYAVVINGRTGPSVAKQYGVSPRSLARWKRDKTLLALVDARRRVEGRPPVPTPQELNAPKGEHVAPPLPELPPADTERPLDEMTRKRLLDAIREMPVPIPIALQFCRLSPRAYAQWVSLAEQDEGIRLLVEDIRQAQAESVFGAMRKWMDGKLRGNIAWALAKAVPQYYRDDVQPETVDESKVEPGTALGRIMDLVAAKRAA